MAPPVIGLTGGIGSGKSTALAAFERRGAAVLSSDEVVHRLYRQPPVIVEVVERFGHEILDSQGAVDRGRLRERAAAQADGLEFLESVIHPRIEGERTRWVNQQRRLQPPPPLLVCEVPLLFEVGLEAAFDAVLVVTASEGVRRARVQDRGQNFDDLASRQLPEQEKASRASSYFTNDGDLEELDAWVEERFEEYSVSSDW
ncbi:MAG: dephospho-CoA kinase [Thermoleophilia bacterium]|nr:dephospho-CoA kinase [Thermoleophilia bacterium]